MRARNRNTLLLITLLIVGIIIGGILGDILSDQVPFLNKSYPIGFQPVHIDLNVIDMTFGLMIDINVASIIGIVLAILIFKRI
ncbi:DUF4321 domain-containing protein [Caldisalinibacter kiritimatiensis]|uniref:DUF4321 domain-containing protein n=1 Tax=Caldisalinibacter kiritimatiensis TaxID=1304284 RepID=R1CM99_9FIRM|nr:DUF4321 domain-containing protein [Caldisalinibacter kiritimatiensis]EOC99830.1 hypothetical protein L21TH_2135 [Caldisalinibacter kiritimatiensis]